MAAIDHRHVGALHGHHRENVIDVAGEGEGRDGSLAVGGEHVVEPDQRLPAIEVEADQNAGDRVGQVVVTAGTMVDTSLCRCARFAARGRTAARRAAAD